MKITGGSFGPDGSAKIGGGKLIINGAKKAEYPAAEIQDVNSTTSKEKSFAFLSFILGAVLLTFVGLLVLGTVGAVVGFVVALMLSFYSKTTTAAEISFADGKSVTLTGTPAELKKLTNLS